MTINIPFSNKVLVVIKQYTSQYKLWWSFEKANWYTNPKSECKGMKCVWLAKIAKNGVWVEFYLLNKV